MEKLMNAQEVAELFGLTPNFVWDQAKKGLIPSVRIGKYRRFRASQLEQWLARQAA